MLPQRTRNAQIADLAPGGVGSIGMKAAGIGLALVAPLGAAGDVELR
jgi:hypothetical protein